MAKNRKALKAIQRVFIKIYNFLRFLFLKLWAGILYIWNRPLLIGGILLIAALFLFNVIIQQTFKAYLNCGYLIGIKLNMPAFFCEGYDVQILGASIFKIPGLKDVMDPPLELVRQVISWSVVLLFAFLSACLTYIINNLKSVVKLLTFNKEQWKSFMESLRTWLFIFVSLCFVFYFMVIR